MSKLDVRYWLETDDFSNTTGLRYWRLTAYCFPLYQFASGYYYSNSIKNRDFPTKKFCEIPTQMHTEQYLELITTYLEGFNMSTANKNPIVVAEDLSFSQQPRSSLLVFDSVKSKWNFHPPNDSNSFGTVDYDAQVFANIDFSMNHVLKSMSTHELDTLDHICEIERTQLQTILAMSVQILQLAGYLLTGKSSNFL